MTSNMMEFEPVAQQPPNAHAANEEEEAHQTPVGSPLGGLAAVEHINRSATAALRSATLTPEQASTLERALNDARIILGREAEGTQAWLAAEAAVLNNLGCLLRRLNRLAESVQFLQHSVFLEQKANGKPSVPTLLNLSAACNALGDTQKACDASLACMSDYANLPSSLRAITLHNLAMCDYHVPQPQVRERVTLLLERAYTEAVQAFGTDHVTTETIYRHLTAITGETSSRNAEIAARAMKPLALSASAPSLVRNIDDGAASLSALQHLQGQQQQQDGSSGGAVGGVMSGAKFSTDADHGAGMNEKEARMLQQRLQEDADSARAQAAADEERRAREDLEKAKAAAAEAEARRIQKQKELEAQKEAQRKYELRTQYQSGTNLELGAMQFMRFGQADAAGAAQSAIPAPVSFTHVREQFRAMSEREKVSRRATFGGNQQQQQQQDSAAGGDTSVLPDGSVSRYGAGLSTIRRQQAGNFHDTTVSGDSARQTHSIFRDTADKRRQKFEKERQEDEEYERVTAVRRAQQRAERQREERLTGLKNRVEYRAASLIQRTWRRHQTDVLQHQALTNKAMRQSEEMRRARRVVRFAKKWLKRSEGRILLCRLRVKFEPEVVYAAVRKVQCAFRCFSARQRCNARRADRKLLQDNLLEFERRHGAAMRLQMWYRVSTCQRNFEKARHDIKAIAAAKIQRWARKVVSRARSRAGEALRRRRENAAAVKIQKTWRGFQGRVAYCMARLQQKMNRLKIKDRRAAERVQRIGRGYLLRKRFSAYAWEEKHRRAVLATQQASGAAMAVRDAKAAREAAAQEVEERKRRVPLRPRPPTPSRERVKAAEAFLDESRRMALDSLQEREQAQLTKEFSRPAPSQYDKMWAVEQLARMRDFNTRRRDTCATVLQRWWRLYRRPVLENHRSRYEAQSAKRKIAYYDDKFRRERLRELNDLAKPIREMREEMQKELQAEGAAAMQEAAAHSGGNVQATNGAAPLFQEWNAKPRGGTERYVSATELQRAKRDIREEQRDVQTMVAQSRKLTSRYG